MNAEPTRPPALTTPLRSWFLPIPSWAQPWPDDAFDWVHCGLRRNNGWTTGQLESGELAEVFRRHLALGVLPVLVITEAVVMSSEAARAMKNLPQHEVVAVDSLEPDDVAAVQREAASLDEDVLLDWAGLQKGWGGGLGSGLWNTPLCNASNHRAFWAEYTAGVSRWLGTAGDAERLQGRFPNAQRLPQVGTEHFQWQAQEEPGGVLRVWLADVPCCAVLGPVRQGGAVTGLGLWTGADPAMAWPIFCVVRLSVASNPILRRVLDLNMSRDEMAALADSDDNGQLSRGVQLHSIGAVGFEPTHTLDVEFGPEHCQFLLSARGGFPENTRRVALHFGEYTVLHVELDARAGDEGAVLATPVRRLRATRWKFDLPRERALDVLHRAAQFGWRVEALNG